MQARINQTDLESVVPPSPMIPTDVKECAVLSINLGGSNLPLVSSRTDEGGQRQIIRFVTLVRSLDGLATPQATLCAVCG